MQTDYWLEYHLEKPRVAYLAVMKVFPLATMKVELRDMKKAEMMVAM